MSTDPPVRSGHVVEIVGVCGSGKSTLTRALTDGDPSYQLEEFLQFKKLDHVKLGLRSVPGVVGLLGGALRSRRLFDLTELKLVIYLMVWYRRIQRQPLGENRVLVIDQGPVYALATLGRTNPPVPGTESESRWRRSVLAQWAKTLDAIIWLDASDDVLWERVQNRSEKHEIKDQPEQLGLEYIRAYRASFYSTLGEFDALGGPVVVRFDTSRWTSERLLSEVRKRVAGLENRAA